MSSSAKYTLVYFFDPGSLGRSFRDIYIHIYTRGSSGSCLERINALARSEIRDSGKMDGKKGKGEKRIFRFFERNHHLFFLFRVVNFQYDIINVRKSSSDRIAAFRSRWREGGRRRSLCIPER